MILQDKEDNCGETAVRNLIAHFYQKEAYGFSKLENRCTSFQEMKKSLEGFGIEYEGYAFNKVKNLKIFKEPKVILVSVDQKKHFLLLYKTFGPLGIIGDNQKGKRLRFLSQLDKQSLNRALVYSSFEKKEILKPELVRMKEKALIWALGFLSFLAGGVGLYGMKEPKFSFLLPLGAFFVLLLEWLEKAKCLAIGQRLSSEVIVPYLAIRPFKEDLIKGEELKKEVEVKALKGLEELLGMFFLLFWLLISSFSELSLVISSLLAYLILSYAFNNYKEKKKRQAAWKGEEIFVEGKLKKENYLASQKASQEFGELCLFQEALTYFFFGLFALIKGLLGGNLEAYSFLAEVIFLSYIGEGLLKPLIQGERYQSSLKSLLVLNEKIYQVEGIYQKKGIGSKKGKKAG